MKKFQNSSKENVFNLSNLQKGNSTAIKGKYLIFFLSYNTNKMIKWKEFFYTSVNFIFNVENSKSLSYRYGHPNRNKLLIIYLTGKK